MAIAERGSVITRGVYTRRVGQTITFERAAMSRLFLALTISRAVETLAAISGTGLGGERS
jgi:Ca2+/H+ antiporter